MPPHTIFSESRGINDNNFVSSKPYAIFSLLCTLFVSFISNSSSCYDSLARDQSNLVLVTYFESNPKCYFPFLVYCRRIEVPPVPILSPAFFVSALSDTGGERIRIFRSGPTTLSFNFGRDQEQQKNCQIFMT